ncbi:MAG TPA: hypothetical protein VMU51_15485 [Mycobacteriales bacterium]|nr:hypothetical protein [Mycobacteriales bacterium]
MSNDGFRNRVAPLVLAGDSSAGHILINDAGMFAYDDTGALFWELLFTGIGSPTQIIQAIATLEVAHIVPLTTAGILNFADPAGSAVPARLANGGYPIPYGPAGKEPFTFSTQSAVTVPVTFPTPFPAGVAPVVDLTVQVGGNLDIIPNLTATPNASGFTARLFQRALANVSGNGTLHWSARPPA